MSYQEIPSRSNSPDRADAARWFLQEQENQRLRDQLQQAATAYAANQAETHALRIQLQQQQAETADMLRQLHDAFARTGPVYPQQPPQQQSAAPPPPPGLPDRPAFSWKMRLPEKFNGSKRDGYALGWLDALRVYACESWLDRDMSQLKSLLTTCFEGMAASWWRGIRQQMDDGRLPPLTSLEEFSQLFTAAYVSPVLALENERQLKHIRQTSTVIEYTARFNRLAVDVPKLPWRNRGTLMD